MRAVSRNVERDMKNTMTRALRHLNLTPAKKTARVGNSPCSRHLHAVRSLVLTGLVGGVLAFANAHAQSTPPSEANGGNQFITLKDGTIVTYRQLFDISEIDYDKAMAVFSSLTDQERRVEKRRFSRWLDSQLDAQIVEKNAQTVEKTAQLRARAEEYVSYAEQGKLIPDQKFIRENILNNPLYDESLKQRARRFVN